MKTNVVAKAINKARDALAAHKRDQTFRTLTKATLLIEQSLRSTSEDQRKTAAKYKKMTESIPEISDNDLQERARKLNLRND